MISRKPVQESTTYLLLQICRLSRARMHAVLGGTGLYRGQPCVLRTLWEKEGVTHSELANLLYVQPATITNMVKRMEKAGFVERRQDPEDQRISRVYLTDAGRAVRDKVQQVWRDLEEQTLAGFNLEERVLLRRFFLQIRENLLRTY